MPPRSRLRRPRRFRPVPRVAVPLLLLVPLGVIKWRADHPPLSKMDETLRTVLGKAPWMRIWGGGTVWQKQFGLGSFQSVLVQDRSLIAPFAEALRCTEQHPGSIPTNGGLSRLEISILVPVPPFRGKTAQLKQFNYWRGDAKSYLTPYNQSGANYYVVVNPRFVPHFEALIADLVQRAKAPGHHPKISLQTGILFYSPP